MHGRGAKMVVDNTFASPCLQRPIEFGADLVVHSTTKYLNGHSDSIGGIVVGVQDEDLEWLKFIQNAEGAILSPFDSFLVLRGTKTLALRMAQHNINGLALAQYPEPGTRQWSRCSTRGYPIIRSTSWRSGRCAASAGCCRSMSARSRTRDRVCNRVKLMSLAESLGGVETLISHPASMTHASVPPERRAAIGLTDSLVRISAGVEDPQDLIDDIAQAMLNV